MKLFRKIQKVKKTIAIFFSILILNSVCFPSYIYASSNGPGQSEFSSFEPVDATDMVNLLTGDFSYSMPVVNVPGPSGGYPLAMFYHAGIKPDQDASWLGLGWNINPGSISRSANGIPDDWNNKTTSMISYNEPNTAEDWAIASGYSFSGVGGGWAIDGGTFKSTSGSVSFMSGGRSLSIGNKGIGIASGFTYMGLSLNYGLYSDYSGNVSGGTSFGVSGIASIGVSMSKNGSDSYLSVADQAIGLGTDVISENDISMKTFTGTFAATIPAPYGDFSLSATYNRYKYWLWKQENKHNYGSLYMKNAKNDVSYGAQHSDYIGDSYENPYNESSYNNYKSQATLNGLSFPNYDRYKVSGQGIGGNISPRLLEFGTMNREGIVFDRFGNGNSQTELVYYNKHDFTKNPNEVYFYFDGDPSGFAKVNSAQIFNGGGNSPMTYTTTGGDFTSTINGQSFYNSTTKHVGQNKVIEYFTNYQIENSLSTCLQKGFIESSSQLGQRGNSNFYDPDGIGAFSITTQDGKTYHYSIPVYQYEEFQVYEQRSNPKGQYLENRKFDKYATDWLLTAVTGPDYVDRGTIGIIDDQDYGYWVKMDYGKWTDGFIWRYPYQEGNYSPSSDGKPYGAYSFGRKQIYYLNSIRTKTHTAYFVKSLRQDSKGKNLQYSPDNEYHVRSKAELTGANPACLTAAYGVYVLETRETEQLISTEPNELLKLDKIILLNNADANLSENNNAGGNNFKTKITSGQFYINQRTRVTNLSGQLIGNCDAQLYNKTFYSYYQENILDNKDVQDNIANIEKKALKVVEFNQDYSLCSNSPNSAALNNSKLTLNSIKFFGNSKSDVMPSYTFDYYNKQGAPDAKGYDANKIDYWGYYSENRNDVYLKPDADAWSLKEIVTPLGGKIKINYESDSYSREAIFGPAVSNSLNVLSINRYSDTRVILQIDGNLSNFDPSLLQINRYMKFDYHRLYGCCGVTNEGVFNGYLKLVAVDLPNNKLEFEINDIKTDSPPNFILPYNVMSTSNPPQPLMPFPDIAKISFGGIAYGGGIRVKNILLDDGAGNQYETEYNYNDPVSGQSSGVTSYSPSPIEKYIPYVFEVPAPMVMYQYVTVSNKGVISGGYEKTRYKFDVLQTAVSNGTEFSIGEHLKIVDLQPRTEFHTYTPPQTSDPETNYWHHGMRRSSIVIDNRSSIGRILEIASLNKADNVQSRVIYDYNNDYYNVGKFQETFNDIKRYMTWDQQGHTSNSSIWSITSTSRLSMPSLLKSISTEANGVKKIVSNSKYDLINGSVTEVEFINSFGEKYHSKVIPAYIKYSGMSSKIYDPSNKNMLVQNTAYYTYSVDASGVEKLLSSNVQTWNNAWDYRAYNSINSKYENSNEIGIYRKHQNYVWSSLNDGDGTATSFVDFVWGAPSQNAGWKKTNEVTLYNHFSQPLEAKDINNQYISTKIGYNNVYPIATVANAKYTSFAYSGAEDLADGNYFGGEVKGADKRYYNKAMAHTGNYSVRLNPGEYGFGYTATVGTTNSFDFKKGQKLRASVWVHKLNKEGARLCYDLLNGTTSVGYAEVLYNSSSSKQIGNYYLLTLDFTIPAGTTANSVDVKVKYPSGAGSLPIYVDDFRIHPQEAAMTSAVYDEQTGWVTAMLDANNFGSKFYYDNAGRLLRVDKETAQGWKKVSESSYHYGRP